MHIGSRRNATMRVLADAPRPTQAYHGTICLMYGEVARKCSSTVRSDAELMRFVAMMLYWSMLIAIVSLGWTSFVTTEARCPKP